jgi:ATP-binding cassette subfamily B protein
LGERGITLSGGQKQRAALARAIVAEPAIVILDDATSSVDTETEHRIFAHLQHVLPGRTSIIISHRVASLKECDQIIYLENGRITEQGTHQLLVALGGAYASLYRRQLMEAELEKM